MIRNSQRYSLDNLTRQCIGNLKTLFDEIEDEMIFRKHLPRQLKINKFLEFLKRKVIHDYDKPISNKELSTEYEKRPI